MPKNLNINIKQYRRPPEDRPRPWYDDSDNFDSRASSQSPYVPPGAPNPGPGVPGGVPGGIPGGVVPGDVVPGGIPGDVVPDDVLDAVEPDDEPDAVEPDDVPNAVVPNVPPNVPLPNDIQPEHYMNQAESPPALPADPRVIQHVSIEDVGNEPLFRFVYEPLHSWNVHQRIWIREGNKLTEIIVQENTIESDVRIASHMLTRKWRSAGEYNILRPKNATFLKIYHALKAIPVTEKVRRLLLHKHKIEFI